MSRVLVLYGTTDGHTAKVAHAISDRLRSNGHDADLVDARHGNPDPDRYDAVIVAASVHARGYQRHVVRWVSGHSGALSGRPTAFVSVCLGVLQHDPQVDREIQAIVDGFLRSTSWRPVETRVVAGALLYRQYNFVKRWVMKRIVRKAGGDTDTTRNYEYTDWTDVQQFTDRFSNRLNDGRNRADASDERLQLAGHK